jgi:tetratricopeptide (TPR) repeat protein
MALLPSFPFESDGVFSMKLPHSESAENEEMFLVPQQQASITLPGAVAPETSRLLQRMFRDPRVLEPHERGDLIAQLRQAVDLAPYLPEVRVLLGMALCVDLQVQEAMEEMREAVKIDPDCFVARLKFGELLMRLRVCDQAAEHTQRASQLASNAAQSELARRQTATIRTMMREGIERGGYGGLLPRVFRFGRKSRQQSSAPVFVGSK